MRKFLSDILVKASLGVEQNAYVLGTVGIGTSSPAYKLDVIGNTRVYGSYLVVDQTAGYNTSILLNQSGIIQWYMTNQATTGKLVFGNGNGDLVWIGTTGNVGIGTSSPSEKLSVNGTFSSNAIWTTSSSITLWGPYSTAYGGLTWDTGQATVYATSGNKLYLASNGASPDMTIDTNGNVGIGTTSPSVKLHLLGTTETSVRVSDSGGAYMELYQQSTDSYILATNSLRFYSGGSERVTLSSGGNVGIGTSSPGEKIDVNGGGRFLSSVTTYAGSGSYYGRISTEYNYPYIETFIDSIAGVSWDGRLVFRTNSNAGAAVTAMVIDPFGKIGMGTSTPGAKLDVRGRTNIWGAGTTSATLGLSVLDNPGSNYNFYVEDNGGAYLRGNVRIGNSTDNGYKFDVSGTGRFTSNLDVDSYILTRSKLQISNGRLFELIGTSTALNIYDASAGSSRIYITDAGNVGIGTTSPVSTLDVNGTVTISGPSAVKWKYSDNYAYFGIGYISGADYGFYNYNYGRTDLYIQQSSGNIGIGTSNTPFLLTVNGYLAATRFIAYNSGAPSYIGNRIDYGTFGSSYGWKIYTDGADMASFFNDRILFNNNVGIGTISPASKLHIAGGDIWVNTVPTTQGIQFGYSGPSHGSYRAAVMGGPEAYGGSDSGMLTFHTQNGYVVSSTPPERMRITSVGNVGIGFAGPEYKLDVNGNTRSNQYIFPFVAFNPSAGARTTTDPMSIKMWQNYFNGTGLGSDYGTVLEYYSRDGHVDSQVYFDASGGSWYRTAAYAASFGAWQKYMTSLDISGTTNYVSKFTSANSLGNSQIFDNGTNVGIGTTSPEAKLDIYSAFAGNNKLFYVRNGAGSVNTQVYDTAVIQSSDVTTLRMVERNVGDTDQLMTFTIGDGYGRISTTAQPLQFFVNGSASGLGYQGLSGTLAMTIATSGNVGIGTASPSYKLQVHGDGGGLYVIGANTAPYNQTIASFVYGGNSNSINIENQGGKASIQARAGGSAMDLHLNAVGGNVGIGITSPAAKLHIAGNLGSTVGGGNSAIKMTNTDTGNFASISAGIVGITNSGMEFSIDGARAMVISGYGNVGIGTTSPGAKLEVTANPGGTTVLLGRASGNSSIKALNDNGGYLALDSTGGATIINHYSSDNIWMVTGGGNVGIGTSGPTDKLHIVGNTNVGEYKVYNGSLNNSAGFELVGSRFNIHGYYGITFNSSAAGIGSMSERMRITPDGNVGIGTSSPSYKLNVVTNAIAGRQNLASIDRTSGNLITFTNPQYSTDSSVGLMLRVFPQSDSRQGAGIIASGGSNNAATDLDLFVTTSPDGLGGTSYSALKITSWGNVGIGTTSPVEKLQVTNGNISIRNTSGGTWGSLRFGTTETSYLTEWAGIDSDWEGVGVNVANLRFYTSYGSIGERMRITSQGDVGIGTTSPASISGYKTLTIDSINGSFVEYRQSGTALFRIGADGSRPFLYGMTNAPMDFYTNTNFWMRLTATGNLGIGTTNPGAKLDITSTSGDQLRISYNSSYYWEIAREASDGRLSFTDSQNGEKVTILPSGNVGIGTTTIFHSAKLSVVGLTHFPFASNSDIGGAVQGFWTQGANGTNYYAGGLKFYYFDNPSGGGYSLQQGMILDGQGNVGIGTSSPSAPLHVYKSVGAGGYVAYIQNTGAGNGLKIYNADWDITDYLLYATNGGTAVNGYAFVVDGNGKVGIGTTSPSSKLEVSNGLIRVSGTDADQYFFEGIRTGSSTTLRIYDNSSNLYYDSYRTMIFRANQNGGSGGVIGFFGGNVGIGTSSPTSALHIGQDRSLRVEGSSSANDNYGISMGGSGAFTIDSPGTYAGRFIINNAGNVGIGTASPGGKVTISTPSAYDGTILKLQSAAEPDAYNFYVNETVTSGVVRWTFNMSNNGTYSNMMVFDRGNVGIGTTSPGDYKLYVNGGQFGTLLRGGDLGIGSDVVRMIKSDNSVAMIVRGDGNVGIGTASPQTKLHVWSSSTGNNVEVARFTSSYGGTGDGPLIRFTNYLSYASNPNSGEYNLGAIKAYDFASSWGGALQFLTANNIGGGGNLIAAMTIDSSQLVGIGTASPSYKLHVEGNVSGISIYASHDIAAFSDITVKKDVERIENAVDKVKELNGYTYVRTDDATGTRRAGVIAQEVQKVLPEVVSQNPDGTLNVAYANMVALLIEAVKEQQKEIDELKRMLNK